MIQAGPTNTPIAKEAAISRLHETEGMVYEYIDADLAGIRRTIEAMYSLDNEDFKDIDFEVV